MKYSPKVGQVICDLIQTERYKLKEVCKMAGICRETFYAWKASKPEFAEALKQVEQRRLDSLRQLAEGGPNGLETANAPVE